eukprot:SAG31_NODE_4288_length_3377_cov_4.228493_2_plen_251_part_00
MHSGIPAVEASGILAAVAAALHMEQASANSMVHETPAVVKELDADAYCVPDELVTFAGELADAATAIIAPYFRCGIQVFDKSRAGQSLDPVTAADKEAEQAMRTLIEERYPDHGVVGEEYSTSANAGTADYVWVLDPVDGTKSFISGTYGFGTLIGLCYRSVPVIGLLHQPILGERWLGVRGRETLFNGKPCRTRSCAEVGLATLFTHDPFATAVSDPSSSASRGYTKLASVVRLKRYSMDCIAYGLVAL